MDFWRTLVIAIVVLAGVAVFYRGILFYCFDLSDRDAKLG
jgi:ABC-type Mn2+/Zn2+ transport system permease subunit